MTCSLIVNEIHIFCFLTKPNSIVDHATLIFLLTLNNIKRKSMKMWMNHWVSNTRMFYQKLCDYHCFSLFVLFWNVITLIWVWYAEFCIFVKRHIIIIVLTFCLWFQASAVRVRIWNDTTLFHNTHWLFLTKLKATPYNPNWLSLGPFSSPQRQ